MSNYTQLSFELTYEQLVELMKNENNLYENCNFYVIDNHPDYLANEFIENKDNLRNCYIKYQCKKGDGAAYHITETYTGNEKYGISVDGKERIITGKIDISA